MREKKIAIITVIAAIGFLVLTVAMAFGAEAADEVREDVTVLAGDAAETIVLEVGDLADGESRTFEENGRTVVVTRRGSAFDVTVEGAGETSKHVFVRGAGDAPRTIRITAADHHADAHAPMVWTTESTGDDVEVKVSQRVEVRKNEDGTVEVTVNGEPVDPSELAELSELPDMHEIVVNVDGHAGAAGPLGHAWLMRDGHGDRIVYRCANDDTEVSIRKTEEGPGVVACPICGTPMEKVERTRVKVLRLHTEAPPKPDTH